VGRPVVDPDFLVQMVDRYKPDAMLIGEDLFQKEDSLRVLGRIIRDYPSVRIVFLIQSKDPEKQLRLARGLFRASIFDVIIPQGGALDAVELEFALTHPADRAR